MHYFSSSLKGHLFWAIKAIKVQVIMLTARHFTRMLYFHLLSVREKTVSYSRNSTMARIIPVMLNTIPPWQFPGGNFG